MSKDKLGSRKSLPVPYPLDDNDPVFRLFGMGFGKATDIVVRAQAVIERRFPSVEVRVRHGMDGMFLVAWRRKTANWFCVCVRNPISALTDISSAILRTTYPSRSWL